MDAIVGEGQAIYHTAGSLCGGRKIFITCKLPEDLKIGDDIVEKYLLLCSSHDGSMSIVVKFTPIRVVCANTMNAAIAGSRSKIGEEVKVRHTRNYKQNITEARNTLGLADYYYQQLEICMNKLLDTKWTDTDMEQMAAHLFPAEEDKDPTTRCKNKRELLCKLYREGIGQGNVVGTKYGMYNAVTLFTDHYKPHQVREGREEKDIHFETTLFGGGQSIKQKALDLLTLVA